MAVWGSKWSSGAPNGRLGLQMSVWSSKWPFGAPNARLELQMAVWSSDGRLELEIIVWKVKWVLGGFKWPSIRASSRQILCVGQAQARSHARVQGQSRFGTTIGPDPHSGISD